MEEKKSLLNGSLLNGIAIPILIPFILMCFVYRITKDLSNGLETFAIVLAVINTIQLWKEKKIDFDIEVTIKRGDHPELLITFSNKGGNGLYLKSGGIVIKKNDSDSITFDFDDQTTRLLEFSYPPQFPFYVNPYQDHPVARRVDEIFKTLKGGHPETNQIEFNVYYINQKNKIYNDSQKYLIEKTGENYSLVKK